jgi:predicted metal-binding protein
MPYQKVIPIIDYKMRTLCVKPYYNHKKGCPNFNKKDGCPPNIGFFDKMNDLTKPVYIIWNEFDLGTHVSNLISKYPQWSEHQLKCCLYWQPKARRYLFEEIKKFKKSFPEYHITKCPEAEGVNITETMKNIGIDLEWHPETKTYQVALAAIKI